MKTIENKPTGIKINDGVKIIDADYAELIKLVISQGKQGGLDYQDIENRLAISAAIKDSPKEISIEDTQFNYLKKAVEAMKWSFWHEDILKFRDDILAVK